MSETFEIRRPHKWVENLEHQITDGIWEDVREWFNVDDIINLTESNIEELEMYHAELTEDRYLDMISIGIRNIINWWENETYVDD